MCFQAKICFFHSFHPFQSTHMLKIFNDELFSMGTQKKTHFRVQCSESCCQFSFTLALGALPFPLYSRLLLHTPYSMQTFLLNWICSILLSAMNFHFKCTFFSRKLWTSAKRIYLLFCTLNYFSHSKIFAFTLNETHLDFHQLR